MSAGQVARRATRDQARAAFDAGGRVVVLDARGGAPDEYALTPYSTIHDATRGTFDALARLCDAEPGAARTVWYVVGGAA